MLKIVVGVIAFGAAIAVAYAQGGMRLAPYTEQIARYLVAVSNDGRIAWRIDTATGAV